VSSVSETLVGSHRSGIIEPNSKMMFEVFGMPAEARRCLVKTTKLYSALYMLA
jgi:hypothetical protein